MALVQKSLGMRSDLNLSDVPEMLPGARPGANPAARWQFEQRCKELHAEAMVDLQDAKEAQMAIGASTPSDLEAMFPTLDASLVQLLAAEAPTPQQALETLLALAAATSAPVSSRPQPPLDLGTDDMCEFPSLTDADGWQVPSRRGFQLDQEAEDKTAWCDHAKRVANLPAPHVVSRKPQPTARRKQQNAVAAQAAGNLEAEADAQWIDSYELRQQQGQRRARRLAQHGRGVRGNHQAPDTQTCEASQVSDTEAVGAEQTE